MERLAFNKTLLAMNDGFGVGARVDFHPLGWETVHSPAGRRRQAIINRKINECDVFLLVLAERWGQDAEDALPYSSYTEEEFFCALKRWIETGSPDIYLMFKQIDEARRDDPGPQLKLVLQFQEQIHKHNKFWYEKFTDEQGSFESTLCKLMKEHVLDPPTAVPPEERRAIQLRPLSREMNSEQEAKRQREVAELMKMKFADQELKLTETEGRIATYVSLAVKAAEALTTAGNAALAIELAQAARIDCRRDELGTRIARLLDGASSPKDVPITPSTSSAGSVQPGGQE